MKPELKQFYDETVMAALKEELGLKNAHEVPQIEKVVIIAAWVLHPTAARLSKMR